MWQSDCDSALRSSNVPKEKIMKNPSKLAVLVAGASTLSLVLATSAFAEERHQDETRRRGESSQTRVETRGERGDRQAVRSNENNARSEVRNDTRTEARTENRDAQARTRESARSYERNDNRGSSRNENRGSYNNNNRSESRGSYNNNGSYNRNDAYRGQTRQREAYRNGIPRSDGRISILGRINRYNRERGGYRVWVGGSNYSYWVPETYFGRRGISIGLDLRLGGIFRNGSVVVDVLGWPGDPYYNDPYYNDGYYNDGGYGGGYSSYDNGYLRGVVDRVDFRTQTLWLDSDRGLVAVDMRSVDRRGSRLDLSDLRRGDRVSLTGTWLRGNVFGANRIDAVGAY
jgi:hypothetical protein